jgi:hypothetical protein|tara:strand:- start:2641 stop:2868 length:228 start_codon:yes stop_codon:yes gene_type:complete
MTFLEFYRVDLTIILIILLMMGITFTGINYVESEDRDIGTFGKILISFILGLLSSIFYSYMTLESDTLLKENYWD